MFQNRDSSGAEFTGTSSQSETERMGASFFLVMTLVILGFLADG